MTQPRVDRLACRTAAKVAPRSPYFPYVLPPYAPVRNAVDTAMTYRGEGFEVVKRLDPTHHGLLIISLINSPD